MSNQMVWCCCRSFAFLDPHNYFRTDSLSTQIKNAGERPRWSQTDAYILVHKYEASSPCKVMLTFFLRIDSLNVRDDTEIDWKQLPDEHWNIWSAHSLQRRWLTMKRGIKGHEEMSHAGMPSSFDLKLYLT